MATTKKQLIKRIKELNDENRRLNRLIQELLKELEHTKVECNC